MHLMQQVLGGSGLILHSSWWVDGSCVIFILVDHTGALCRCRALKIPPSLEHHLTLYSEDCISLPTSSKHIPEMLTICKTNINRHEWCPLEENKVKHFPSCCFHNSLTGCCLEWVSGQHCWHELGDFSSPFFRELRIKQDFSRISGGYRCSKGRSLVTMSCTENTTSL